MARDPVRVLDTRDGIGAPRGTIGAGGKITLDLAAYRAPTTTAVVLNVTAVSPTQPTFVTAWPAGAARPPTSNLNVRRGEIRSNQVTVPVSADMKVDLYNNSGNTHLVADLVGWYDTAQGNWFNTVAPQRLLDTRTTDEPFQALTGRTIDVSGVVPPAATSVVLNVTAVRPELDTFLTVFPDIFAQPNISSVNAMRGDITANMVTVSLSPRPEQRGQFAVMNHGGTTHVTIDLVGYYSPDEGDAFHPMYGMRAYDSRATIPVPAGTHRRVPLDSQVPPAATTVLTNLTGIATTDTYLTAYQAGTARPGTSTLNLATGQTTANGGVAGIGVQRGIDVYNNNGDSHIVVDVAGYFTPRA